MALEDNKSRIKEIDETRGSCRGEKKKDAFVLTLIHIPLNVVVVVVVV